MNFRGKLYARYVETHTARLYGEVTTEAICHQYPAWDYYFGTLLPRDRGAAIADLGCGYGGFVQFLKDRGYENTVGVDVSKQQVDLGVSLGIRNVICEDALSYLSSQAESLDLVVARDV